MTGCRVHGSGDSIALVSGDDPVFLIAHGTDDTSVPVAQGQKLFEALRSAGVTASFTPVAGANRDAGTCTTHPRWRKLSCEMTAPSDRSAPSERRPLARRITAIAAEAALVLLAAALIAAILAPVFHSVSDNPDRYEFFGPPARRR